MKKLIKEILIINEGLSFLGSLLIDNEKIGMILNASDQHYSNLLREAEEGCDEVIEGRGKILIPGVIDDQVHFRQPGATYKGDIHSESAAAALGGVTSFMDMPNNTPPICTIEELEGKYSIAATNSYTNYSFYLGANNDNLSEIVKVDPKSVCGIKIFMGSSTGQLLVDNKDSLENIFKYSPTLIAIHCEDNDVINKNLTLAKNEYGDNIPTSMHPVIRSREACIKSSNCAIELAIKHSSRIHILHISTKEEIDTLSKIRKDYPFITAEACVHYLWFSDKDYQKYGNFIKCNPAIKSEGDMLSIRRGIKDGVISALATDHAPHLYSEKDNLYISSPSGLPLVQHSLQIVMELAFKGIFSKEEVVEAMCHAPARCFNISKRGFIREGYYADLVILQSSEEINYRVSKDNIAYKCGWSPFEGKIFHTKIIDTYINGTSVVKNGELTSQTNSKRLLFNCTDE